MRQFVNHLHDGIMTKNIHHYSFTDVKAGFVVHVLLREGARRRLYAGKANGRNTTQQGGAPLWVRKLRRPAGRAGSADMS